MLHRVVGRADHTLTTHPVITFAKLNNDEPAGVHEVSVWRKHSLVL